jgi:hypothetical protein
MVKAYNKSGLRTPKPLRGLGARSLKRYEALRYRESVQNQD